MEIHEFYIPSSSGLANLHCMEWIPNGEVKAVDAGVATIMLPGGGVIQARGQATVGQRVFVRDGVIEGPAPDLTDEIIEV